MRKCGNKKCCGSFSAFAKCGMGTRKRSRSRNRKYLEWVNLIWNQTKHASHLVSIQSWEMGSSAYWTKYARRTSQLNLGKTNWNKYFLPEPKVFLFTQQFYFCVDKQYTNLLAQHLLLDHMTECSVPSVFRTICMRHWQLIWSKLGFYFSFGITLDVDAFFLWRTSYWYIEDKTYKKVERNPF